MKFPLSSPAPQYVRLRDLDLPDFLGEPVAVSEIKPVVTQQELEGPSQYWMDPYGNYWTRKVHGDDTFGRWRESAI